MASHGIFDGTLQKQMKRLEKAIAEENARHALLKAQQEEKLAAIKQQLATEAQLQEFFVKYNKTSASVMKEYAQTLAFFAHDPLYGEGYPLWVYIADWLPHHTKDIEVIYENDMSRCLPTPMQQEAFKLHYGVDMMVPKEQSVWIHGN
jgi:DNA-directed RNA polymerase subunit F